MRHTSERSVPQLILPISPAAKWAKLTSHGHKDHTSLRVKRATSFLRQQKLHLTDRRGRRSLQKCTAPIVGVDASATRPLARQKRLSSPFFCTKISPLATCCMLKKWEVCHKLSKSFMLTKLDARSCGKPLWITLWRMWKSGAYQQLFSGFPPCRPRFPGAYRPA